MLNLAPLRYSKVLRTEGGPIECVECASTSVMGERRFQANAFLSASVKTWDNEQVLYGNADGSGTSSNATVAQHMAISEALERWAHRVASHGPDRARYGFDVDPSSNGMAAFPGWTNRQARLNAQAEAAERFCIAAWWIGALDARYVLSPWPNVGVLQIENPLSKHVVVILHALADQELHAYGFGSGATLTLAFEHAAVELTRAQYVLRRHARRGPFEGHVTPLGNLFEQRILYFSSENGYASFAERTGRGKWKNIKPEVLFDGEIDGPWSRYACVWRQALCPPSPDFLAPVENFFFW